jgi:hypothetical protein
MEPKFLGGLLARTLPTWVAEIAELSGKGRIRIPVKVAALAQRRALKYLQIARPYLIGIAALRGELDANACHYALMEGLVREYLKFWNIRVGSSEDALERCVVSQERQVPQLPKAVQSVPEYNKIARMIARLTLHMTSVTPGGFDATMNEWPRSKDARAYLNFTRQWTTVMRQARHVFPTRPTEKFVLQVCAEYHHHASFVEQRLRLFNALLHDMDGAHHDWLYWDEMSLNNILQKTAASPLIARIGKLVDRHVRNAIAHRRWDIRLGSKCVYFMDVKATVKWPLEKLFRKAKALTFASVALAGFEHEFQLAQMRETVGRLWLNAVPQGSPQGG